MNILERIINSVGEPGKHDLWLRSKEGGAELLAYLGNEWVPICGCSGGGSQVFVFPDSTAPLEYAPEAYYKFADDTNKECRKMAAAAKAGNLVGSTEQSADSMNGVVNKNIIASVIEGPYSAKYSLDQNNWQMLYFDDRIYDFVDAVNKRLLEEGSFDYLIADNRLNYIYDVSINSYILEVTNFGPMASYIDGYIYNFKSDEDGFITGVEAGESTSSDLMYFFITEEEANMLVGTNADVSINTGSGHVI